MLDFCTFVVADVEASGHMRVDHPPPPGKSAASNNQLGSSDLEHLNDIQSGETRYTQKRNRKE